MLAKSLPRLKKKKASAMPNDAGPSFPLGELPVELQLMIARECVLAPVPIVVGRKVARWHSDPREELYARHASAMLRTCHSFRKELYRLYYENNVFELGYYYDMSNFFKHPGKDLVRYVLVDALRILVEPSGLPKGIVFEKLRLLPNLKAIYIRLRGSVLFNSVFYEAKLVSLLIRLSTTLPVETVDLVIEPSIDMEGADQLLQDYKDFLSESLAPEVVWPSGVPKGRKMVQFGVSLHKYNASLIAYCNRCVGRKYHLSHLRKPSRIREIDQVKAVKLKDGWGKRLRLEGCRSEYRSI
jgi:hypothetical protein